MFRRLDFFFVRDLPKSRCRSCGAIYLLLLSSRSERDVYSVGPELATAELDIAVKKTGRIVKTTRHRRRHSICCRLQSLGPGGTWNVSYLNATLTFDRRAVLPS